MTTRVKTPVGMGLDILVAEKVMGCTVGRYQDRVYCECLDPNLGAHASEIEHVIDSYRGAQGDLWPLASYSTNWAAMGLVVEKMREREYRWFKLVLLDDIGEDPGWFWGASFDDTTCVDSLHEGSGPEASGEGSGATPEEAVCRAALAAVASKQAPDGGALTPENLQRMGDALPADHGAAIILVSQGTRDWFDREYPEAAAKMQDPAWRGYLLVVPDLMGPN